MNQFRKVGNLVTLVVFITTNFLNPISVVLAEDSPIPEKISSDSSVISEFENISLFEDIDGEIVVENGDIVGGGMNLII